MYVTKDKPIQKRGPYIRNKTLRIQLQKKKYGKTGLCPKRFGAKN
jgi:hypothetical protein